MRQLKKLDIDGTSLGLLNGLKIALQELGWTASVDTGAKSLKFGDYKLQIENYLTYENVKINKFATFNKASKTTSFMFLEGVSSRTNHAYSLGTTVFVYGDGNIVSISIPLAKDFDFYSHSIFGVDNEYQINYCASIGFSNGNLTSSQNSRTVGVVSFKNKEYQLDGYSSDSGVAIDTTSSLNSYLFYPQRTMFNNEILLQNAFVTTMGARDVTMQVIGINTMWLFCARVGLSRFQTITNKNKKYTVLPYSYGTLSPQQEEIWREHYYKFNNNKNGAYNAFPPYENKYTNIYAGIAYEGEIV